MKLEMKQKRRYCALFPEIAMRHYGEATVRQLMSSSVKMAVDTNTLGQTSQTLWQTVASKAIDTVSKKYAFLDGLTTDIREAVTVEGPGAYPIVNVEVVTGAGDALTDATDWEKSALANKYVPVTLHRKSRPGGLTSYDLMNGERIETKLAAMVESVMAGAYADFCAAVAAVMPSTLASTTAPASGKAGVYVYDPAAWGPETVARDISPLFGEYGPVENLVLTPDLLAPLIPVNALSLGYAQPGTYGIDRIESTAGLAAAVTGNKCGGLALRKNAICMAAAPPPLDGMTSLGVRSLGTVAGIPLCLKMWEQPGQEIVWFSVETMVGFAVSNAAGIYALVEGSGTSTTPGT